MKKHASSIGEAVLQLAAACGDLKRSVKATPGSDGTGGDAEGRKTHTAFPRSRHRWAPRENTSIKPTTPTSGEQTADKEPLRRAVGALPPGCSTEPCSAASLPKTSGQAIFNRLRPSSRERGSEEPSSDLPPLYPSPLPLSVRRSRRTTPSTQGPKPSKVSSRPAHPEAAATCGGENGAAEPYLGATYFGNRR